MRKLKVKFMKEQVCESIVFPNKRIRDLVSTACKIFNFLLLIHFLWLIISFSSASEKSQLWNLPHGWTGCRNLSRIQVEKWFQPYFENFDKFCSENQETGLWKSLWIHHLSQQKNKRFHVIFFTKFSIPFC